MAVELGVITSVERSAADAVTRRAPPGASGASCRAGGRTALVLDAPVEVRPACGGHVWISMPVAKHLDERFTQLLASGADSVQIHWDSSVAA